MIVRNKATNKEYPMSMKQWGNLNPAHKALFLIVLSDDSNMPKEQVIVNQAVKERKKKNKYD